MDPNFTLRLFIESLQENDRETAIDCLENLLGWINNGGFLPDGEKFKDVY